MVESCANDEHENNILIKTFNKVFKAQECDATEVDLCTAVWFIKYKNTDNNA